MRQYVARRVLIIIPTLILVTIAVAGLIRLTPGDVLVAQIAEVGFLKGEDLARARKELGLDKPFHAQYISWIGNVARGDFGNSMFTFRSVRSEIGRTLPVTVQLGAMALLVGVLIGIPVGVYSALRQDTIGDYISRVAAIVGVAAPHFWIATLFIVFAATWAGYFPPLRYYGPLDNLGSNLRTLVFPAIILGVGLAAGTTRMVRSSTLEVIRQDYVRTAYAKGLSRQVVITRHVLKNAFIPVITIVGGQAAFLMGGSVIIESVFSLPGMGRLTLLAIQTRDYTQLQANVLIFSFMVLFLNFLVDVSYGWFDPRIRYGGSS